MTTETSPKSQEVKPLDFSKIEALFKKLDPRKVDSDFQIARLRLNDGNYVVVIKTNRSLGSRDKELIYDVAIGNDSMPRDLRFQLAQDGLRSLSQSSVDINREPFGFDVSVGETHVGRWWIHGKKQTLELDWISSPLKPREEDHVKAGELMMVWLQSIIDAGSLSESPINLSLIDPKTIK